MSESSHEDGHSAKRKFDCVAHNNEASDCVTHSNDHINVFVSDTLPCKTHKVHDDSNGNGSLRPILSSKRSSSSPCISCWAFLTDHRSTLITAEQLDTHSASSASYASSDSSDSSDSSHPRLLTLPRIIELVRQVGGVAGELISVNGLTNKSPVKAKANNNDTNESCDYIIPTCYRDFVRQELDKPLEYLRPVQEMFRKMKLLHGRTLDVVRYQSELDWLVDQYRSSSLANNSSGLGQPDRPQAISTMPGPSAITPFHTVPYQPISTVDITAQLGLLSTRQLRLLYEISMMLLMYSVSMPESKLQNSDHSDQDKSLSDLSMFCCPKQKPTRSRS